MALQWPELHAMLLHSNRRTVGQMMLFNTIMGGRVQWAVGCTLPTAQETFPNDIAVNIITSALKVHIGTSNVVALSESLPGLVGVLGGSKLGMRRLNTTGGLLSSTASLATGIADTLQGKPDVGGIFQSSRDIFKQVVNLWEDR
ncbi:hypothetical protein [Arthrobacter polaris]|uniref:hypothetical protein n=1 Tax=Arthrobacter polaris TaxID=2813727 RepID=UPI001F2DF69A|nr:hypothetical protein [Arthrobacter polaris]UIK89871.1 hypothetical protein J0916_05880 [Arthrobacter polaris]